MLGSTLGALTAMMFTTKKGNQVKEEFLDQYHEFEGRVKGYANKNKRKAKRAVKQAAKNIENTIRQAKRKLKKRIRR